MVKYDPIWCEQFLGGTISHMGPPGPLWGPWIVKPNDKVALAETTVPSQLLQRDGYVLI